jgi:hypothetical protein
MAEEFIDKVFGHGGLIDRFHDAYEYRSGQIEMAERVTSAFAEKKHLIVEAGTGTGKTLAYLVPGYCRRCQLRKTDHHLDRHKESAGTADGKGSCRF